MKSIENFYSRNSLYHIRNREGLLVLIAIFLSVFYLCFFKNVNIYNLLICALLTIYVYLIKTYNKYSWCFLIKNIFNIKENLLKVVEKYDELMAKDKEVIGEYLTQNRIISSDAIKIHIDMINEKERKARELKRIPIISSILPVASFCWIIINESNRTLEYKVSFLLITILVIYYFIWGINSICYIVKVLFGHEDMYIEIERQLLFYYNEALNKELDKKV